MATAKELDDSIDRVIADNQLQHDWMHGGVGASVQTEGGTVRSPARLIADLDAQAQAAEVARQQAFQDAETTRQASYDAVEGKVVAAASQAADDAKAAGDSAVAAAASATSAALRTPSIQAQTAQNTVTLDLSLFRSFDFTLSDATILSVANAPSGTFCEVFLSIRQSAAGGSTLQWPSVITWVAGAPPVLSDFPNARGLYRLVTTDGGLTWLGFVEANDLYRPSMVAFDDFTGAVNTVLTGRTTPVGAKAWSVTGAGTDIPFVLDGNGNARPNTPINAVSTVFDSGLSDFTVYSAMVSFSSAGEENPRLLFRFVDANNYWYVEADALKALVTLYSVVAGVTKTINSIKYRANLGNAGVYGIRVDCYGKQITLWLNGTKISTWISADMQTGTKIGMQSRVITQGANRAAWKYIAVLPFSGTVFNWPDTPVDTQATPIVPLGASGAWDDTDCNNPNVIADPVNGGFLLEYSGYHNDGSNGGVGTRIQHSGYARATSLAGPWTKDANNPVMTSNADDGYYAFNGGIVYFNNQFIRAYVTASDSAIGLATSPDGYAWTRLGTIIKAVAGSWKDKGAFDPFLRITAGGTLEMWYAGQTTAGVRGFGRAISSDGINWTDLSVSTYVFQPAPELFRNATIGEPTAIVPSAEFEGTQWLITFDGVPYGTDATVYRQLNQALTVDGGQSWHYRSGYFVPNGLPSRTGWRSKQVFDNFPYRDGDTLHLFYGGADKAGASLNLDIQVGHATTAWAVTDLRGSA